MLKKVLGVVSLVVTIGVSDSASSEDARLTVEGTEFVLHVSDDRVVRANALAGAVLHLTEGAIKIDAVEQDTTAVGGEVFLYHLLLIERNGAASEFCDADYYGKRLGFPLVDPDGRIRLTCTAGAVAKCVRFGYRFWERGEEQEKSGVSMADLHRACVHMVRADYGGDDRPSTRNGTLIEVYDRFGIQKPAEQEGMSFEAAWGINGAICVAHPRIRENISLLDLAERYPSLRSALGPEACTEENMRNNPAVLLFNKSF